MLQISWYQFDFRYAAVRPLGVFRDKYDPEAETIPGSKASLAGATPYSGMKTQWLSCCTHPLASPWQVALCGPRTAFNPQHPRGCVLEGWFEFDFKAFMPSYNEQCERFSSISSWPLRATCKSFKLPVACFAYPPAQYHWNCVHGNQRT